ncbi:hypothetical protein PENTCL1PPCAC_24894 [Pristionchus entomophagus]|uniref:Uncharacterized protein n=1 Tax=Pristionchus entomophagus TaxID=358040 RepID=A0AAV5U7A1_9BILA|nr:hypothetical protein PENTCL1PPCAC_24894 [Pristionchus entomophagus]
MLLLNRIKKGYSLMCIMRNSGELALKSNDIEAERSVNVENLVLTPARYSTIMSNVYIARNALIEFANFSFNEFRVLDTSCKDSMVESSFPTFNILESTYRACRHFPKEATRTPGYTTFLHYVDLERYFENCPYDIDTYSLIRELKKYFVESSKIVRQHIESCDPTDVVFAALLGLVPKKLP